MGNEDERRRGMCEDLHMDYKCSCRSGYEQKFLEDKPKNQTCLPVICGKIEVQEFAKSSLTGEANYDTAPWTITCDPGYTLDGDAIGKRSFEQSCMNLGSFSDPKPCLPVTCGSPLSV